MRILRYRAFAASPEGGNAAGVVLGAEGLSTDAMQRIATEIGYSETAFLLSDPGESAPLLVRYFSPAAEVPFCGHATVALAVAIATEHGGGTYQFATQVGAVTLAADADADGQIEVAFTSVEPDLRDMQPQVLAELLEALGLQPGDLAADFPPKEAFAGNWHPILVLHDRDVFDQFRFDPAVVRRLMDEHAWAGTVTILRARSRESFEARNLFPVGRITEDPATGSAAAATGAYLRAIGQLPDDGELTIAQGAHVGRPSVLRVSVPPRGGVTVRGTAVLIEGPENSRLSAPPTG